MTIKQTLLSVLFIGCAASNVVARGINQKSRTTTHPIPHYTPQALIDAQKTMKDVFYCLQHSAEENDRNWSPSRDGLNPKEILEDAQKVDTLLQKIKENKNTSIRHLVEHGASEEQAREYTESILVNLSKDMAKGHFIAAASSRKEYYTYKMIERHYLDFCKKGEFADDKQCEQINDDLKRTIQQLYNIYA